MVDDDTFEGGWREKRGREGEGEGKLKSSSPPATWQPRGMASQT